MKTALFLSLVLCTIPAAAQLRHPAPQLLFAGSGSVAGANGTFFHSDVSVLNYRTQNQQVAFQWLPEGGTAPAAVVITINASSGIIDQDFVGTVLHVSGIGSLLITGINADGTPDPNALLYATERVWTNQPGSNGGTVSQTFPAIATSDINLTRATILGQRLSSQYRTNVGVVNLDMVSRDFDVIQTTDDPATQITTTITVGPMSMQQIPLQAGTVTALQIAVQPRVQINPALWIAYGSSVDNVTGDSWSSLGFQAR